MQQVVESDSAIVIWYLSQCNQKALTQVSQYLAEGVPAQAQLLEQIDSKDLH